MSPVETVLAVVFSVSILLGLPAVAYASAMCQPLEAWAAIGRRRGRWVVLFPCWPLLIGPVAIVAYFVVVRPKLLAHPRLPRLEPGARVQVIRGPHAGRRATIYPARGIMRLPTWIGFVTMRFADEKRVVSMARDALTMSPEDEEGQ